MFFSSCKIKYFKFVLLFVLLLVYMYVLSNRAWEIYTNFLLLIFLNIYFLLKNQTVFQKLSGRVSAFIFTNMGIVYWDHGALVYLLHNRSSLSRLINGIISEYESNIAVNVYSFFGLNTIRDTCLYLNLFRRAYWVLLIIIVFFIGDIIAKLYLNSIYSKVKERHGGDYNLWWHMNQKKIDKQLIRITVIWFLIFYLV
ncbi:hypothetical protein [Veillonella sp. R32]|uniref:hypothetical protein n=1 Tax=Veillonella sp. R32 TaxID=2021312 RepID=UPI00138A6344|nr:hypothetical protein [Veillonella sp. R32]KAF1682649.1 hypothetical protein VER_04760 [Veillonella sp. R32]